MLNTTTNLYLKIIAKTKGNTTYTITGTPVPQKFRTKDVANNFGNTTVTDGYITINNTTTSSFLRANVGTVNEVVTHSLSSIMPFNKALKIALVALSPSTGYSLLKKPKPVLRKRINGLEVFLVGKLL